LDNTNYPNAKRIAVALQVSACAVLLIHAASLLLAASEHREFPGADVKSGTATGSISGKVKFEGQPPKPAHINTSSDPSCPKSASSSNEEFVLGSGGTLANVVVYVSDGLGDRNFEVPTQAAVVEQKGCMYEPHVLALRANQKLQVINRDTTMHNIHPLPQNNREWNKAQPSGTTLEEIFTREEVAIPVKCNVHPWMRSYIAVLKHPFFAVTSKDGGFDLHNLPPGEYTVEAWHESLGRMKQKITVAIGQATTLDFVFKAPGH
jgi:plastocyanin